MTTMIDTGLVAEHNAKLAPQLQADYEALGGVLARRGQDKHERPECDPHLMHPSPDSLPPSHPPPDGRCA